MADMLHEAKVYTVIWKIFTVELFSFCAIINEIKLHEFFSTTDN